MVKQLHHLSPHPTVEPFQLSVKGERKGDWGARGGGGASNQNIEDSVGAIQLSTED